MNNEEFDFVVINLKDRKDRWEKIEKNFSDYKLLRLEAVKHNNGAVGCFKSHQEAIKIAKKLGLKKIFVLEDDCIPCENFKERFNIIKEYLDNNDDWNLYYGGVIIKPEWCKGWENNFKEYLNYKGENFVRLSKSYTTHFTVYKETVYDYFLNINKYKYPIDAVWHLGYNMPKLTALTSHPFIGTQDDGYSNILNIPTSIKGKTKLSQELLAEYIEKNKE